jgi:hypothetical protein
MSAPGRTRRRRPGSGKQEHCGGNHAGPVIVRTALGGGRDRRAVDDQVTVLSRCRHDRPATPAKVPAEALSDDCHAPAGAVRRLVKNEVDYLPIGELFGRVATTLWVVYPPGIATVVPRELLDERAQPMIDYLKVFEQGTNFLPGFENEIQGVYREKKRPTVRRGCSLI